MRRDRRLGWTPDHPDIRDYKLKTWAAASALPPMVDLRSICPPVVDQGQLGSCTANAIGSLMWFMAMKQALGPKLYGAPSRLFIYYNERDMEGSVDSDAGAMIRDGIKSVATLGVCPEDEWPYSDANLPIVANAYQTKPTPQCYADAQLDKAIVYERLDNTVAEQLKSTLADGFPFVMGFTVYDSFMSQDVASTGVVPMPAKDENVLGGHAVMAVGYDDAKSVYIVRNSWGPTWGDQGYFYMPAAYVESRDLADDFWKVTVSE